MLGRHPRRTLLRAGVLAAVTWLIVSFWMRPCRVSGTSMEPTFRDGGMNVIDLRRYRDTPPRRDDLVAARMHSLDNKRFYFKRVIGLPGETVGFTDGMRMVDGKPLPESYLADRGTWNVKPITLGPDEYFIIGDNRSVPWEQHMGGAIERRHIIGGILFP